MIDGAATPLRMDQIAVAVHTEELERGIARPSPTRLPMADGPHADTEKGSSLFTGHAAKDSGIPKLCVADYGTMRRFV